MQTTKTNSTKKAGKIPAVKHFYDIDAAKKAKKLAKKVVNSNLAKTFASGKGGKKASSSEGFVGAALAAPIAIQIGTFAALAAGGYALWKNREKVQSFVTDLMNKEVSDTENSMGA